MRLRLTRALFVAIGLGCVLAAPNVSTRSFKTHSVHEKRDSLPNGWTKRSAASRDLILPMRFNLVQSNLDRAEELLLSVSNPASPSFGKHYSLKDIADIFAPSDESISSIMDWFAHAGISSDRVKYSKSKGAYLANLTVAEAEDLRERRPLLTFIVILRLSSVHAKYDIYEHSESGSVHIACPHYAVPSILTEHIDFVTPTIHFDTNPINTLLKPSQYFSTVSRVAATLRFPSPRKCNF
jgi:tripeptidyl-peptidase-1